MEGKIREVFKYKENDNENWVFSLDETNDLSNNYIDRIYNYYLLAFKNNCPTIVKINNPMDLLNNIQDKYENIPEGSLNYLRFLAYKQIAENKIISKIKMRK